MTDQYTPTTAEVERCFIVYGRVDGPLHPEDRRAEFFRWLTDHDESIRDQALADLTRSIARDHPHIDVHLPHLGQTVPLHVWLTHHIQGDKE